LNEQDVMEAHLRTLRDKQLIKFSMFSVFKIDQCLTDAEVLCQFKNRFKNAFSLDNVDCVVVHTLEEPVVQVEETEDRLETSGHQTDMNTTKNSLGK
jgi:hypothetical protein